ncbi:unnamed protein product, partial [Polarella glacialis]
AYLPKRRPVLLRRLRTLAGRFDGQAVREPFVFAGGGGSSSSTGRRYDFAGLARRLEALDVESSSSSVPSSLQSQETGSEESEPPPTARDDGCDRDGSDDEDSQRCCRICHLTADESDAPLLAPCSCSGSIGYGHSACLLQWLLHSRGSVPSEWRCDVCSVLFRVESQPGPPPGRKLLQRPLLDFIDFETEADCSPMVHALLLSLAQVMVTGLCCAVANMLYGAAALLCHPMPSMLSSLLQWPLALPAVIVDVISISLYWCLLFVKALVITELLGLRQFPERGVLDLVLKQLLTWSAETLTFFCDLRVLGLMALASYFTADHLIRSCFQTGGLRA